MICNDIIIVVDRKAMIASDCSMIRQGRSTPAAIYVILQSAAVDRDSRCHMYDESSCESGACKGEPYL